MIDPQALVPTLLALQFAVFGWRVAREIAVGDDRRKTWLLLCDYLNFTAMLAVIGGCVVYPLCIGAFPKIARMVLASGYTFMAFVPLIIAGHYRLFSRLGRSVYHKPGMDYPWVTDQEGVLTAAALIAAALPAYLILRY